MQAILTPYSFVGLSTDTKPTTADVGSTFYEVDTRNSYICFDGSQWVLSKTSADSASIITTVDLDQAAGAKTAYTATTQNCFIDYVGVYIPVDVSGSGALTSISVQSTDVSPITFISTATGAVANLTAGKLLSYTGPEAVVASTKTITLTIAGGAAGTTCNAILFISYRPVVAGGYLLIA